jgi:hypothetical protein
LVELNVALMRPNPQYDSYEFCRSESAKRVCGRNGKVVRSVEDRKGETEKVRQKTSRTEILIRPMTTLFPLFVGGLPN